MLGMVVLSGVFGILRTVEAASVVEPSFCPRTIICVVSGLNEFFLFLNNLMSFY